jgi:hypothetical protein
MDAMVAHGAELPVLDGEWHNIKAWLYSVVVAHVIYFIYKKLIK